MFQFITIYFSNRENSITYYKVKILEQFHSGMIFEHESSMGRVIAKVDNIIGVDYKSFPKESPEIKNEKMKGKKNEKSTS